MPNCPRCGSADTERRGRRNDYQRLRCKQCELYFADRGSPVVTVFDIETLPLWFFGWDIGQQYVNYKQIIRDYAVLGWAAKRLFSSEVQSDILTPQETKDYDDYRILKRIWKILDESDVVITQNGKKFDVKKLNTRFAYYRMPPPRPYHHIDTLDAARAVFALTSTSLDYASMYFGVGKKIDTDFELWVRCVLGERKALDEMNAYNIHDIWLLEDYYALIRAWIPNHPNFSAYTHNYVDLNKGERACPVCRGVITESAISDRYKTPLGYVYKSFRCQHCGATGRMNERLPGQKVEVRPNR